MHTIKNTRAKKDFILFYFFIFNILFFLFNIVIRFIISNASIYSKELIIHLILFNLLPDTLIIYHIRNLTERLHI